jgi:hypothetical protein
MAGATRKITLEVPHELLRQAQRATGAGITETVRAGLRSLAAAEAREHLLRRAGKVRFGLTWQEMKDDR